MAQANKKPVMVQFEKNGIRHVREVKEGEDVQEVLARPTMADLKQRRIKDEEAILARIPDSADVMAYAHVIKFELKQAGIRFPCEVYEYTKKRMEGEAQPFKTAIKAVREDENRRPDPAKTKTLNVCPKCKQRFKRVDMHLRACTGTLDTFTPPSVA